MTLAVGLLQSSSSSARPTPRPHHAHATPAPHPRHTHARPTPRTHAQAQEGDLSALTRCCVDLQAWPKHHLPPYRSLGRYILEWIKQLKSNATATTQSCFNCLGRLQGFLSRSARASTAGKFLVTGNRSRYSCSNVSSTVVHFCPGATFVVPRRQAVLVPRDTLRQMLHEIASSWNPRLGGWYMEYAWERSWNVFWAHCLPRVPSCLVNGNETVATSRSPVCNQEARGISSCAYFAQHGVATTPVRYDTRLGIGAAAIF